MKHSPLFCILLCFNLTFAQLTVENNAYVFVNDQVLFVTDYVNLEDAYVNATNPGSNIYLRNEAQLLQDFTALNSVNTGEGSLSVYQTGNVNQWAYNYWCSPVGNNSMTPGNEDARVNLLNDATGLITFTPAAFTTGYDGSPSPLTISSRWLWTYQTSSSYADWVYVGDTGPINPGLGFTMKGNGTGATGSQLYDFRGKPNNGTIGNLVTNGDFTLVGNPYPSAMDSAEFIHDTQNAAVIDGTLFYWEQDASIPLTQTHVLQEYVGGYSEFTINASGAIISNAPATFFTYDEQDNVLSIPAGPPAIGTKMALRYIPIGQGFMVQGTAGGTVRAKNDHRVFEKQSGGQSLFFRSKDNNTPTETGGIQYQENGLSIVPDDYKRFRINVDFSVDNANYTRQMLLNFHHTATPGFDYGLELSRSDNYANDAYFSLDDKAYSGQAYAFEDALKIPLVVDIEQQQPLRFRIFDIQNFEDSQDIFIHDTHLNTYVNLRNSDYELNVEPGHYTDRFEIVFTPQQNLDIDEFDISTLQIYQNNDNHQLLVKNPKSLDITAIEVYDVTGKRLLKSLFNSILDQYELSTTTLSDGIYVVNVISNANSTLKSQKIIVKN